MAPLSLMRKEDDAPQRRQINRLFATLILSSVFPCPFILDYHLRDLSFSRRPDAQYSGHRLRRRSARDPHWAGRQNARRTAAGLAQSRGPHQNRARSRPRLPRAILPKHADAAQKLKQRTLTAHNQRPQWLAGNERTSEPPVAGTGSATVWAAKPFFFLDEARCLGSLGVNSRHREL